MTLIKGLVIGFLAGVVTLIGRVRSAAMQQEAERIARGVNGVTDVHNELVFGKVTS